MYLIKRPRQAFERLIERMEDLPSIPSSVALIIQTLDDLGSSARDLSQALGLDQSLTSSVLKTVNSAYYGFPRRIDTLDQAVTILGYRAIRDIVLVTSLFNELDRRSKKISLDRERFWRHAAGCGVAARAIAERTGTGFGENVYLAGLLHDIGKVFLDAFLHEEYTQVLAKARQENILLIEAETQTLGGVNHTDFGMWLADEWNLPLSFAATIAYHHSPTQSQDYFVLACLVHVADVMVRALEIGYGGDELIPAIDHQAWVSLHLTPGLLDQIILDIDEQLAEALSAR